MEYIFTFGIGTSMANKCVKVHADSFREAESKFRDEYGTSYCSGYPYEDWKSFNDKHKHKFKAEEIVREIK